MKDFEILDISGDVGIRAFGKDIEGAFVHAALGMFSLITSLKTIAEEKTMDITVESDSLDGLLVSWLNELIFHFDTYGFIGRKIIIHELIHRASQTGSLQLRKLKATISGEEFDPQRHDRKLLIKAATYHKLSVEKAHGIWEIHVIFDI
jgi:SHS2 domain-containing protein